MEKILIISVLIWMVFFIPKNSLGENQTDIEINELSTIGTSFLQQGKFHDALEYFDKILVIAPNDVITLGNKGAALTQLNRYEEALVEYDKALEIDPRNTSILNNKAATLFNLGKVDETLQTLDEILMIEPNNVKVLNLKGKVLTESKRYGEAFSIFKKALEIDPQNEDAIKQSYFAINNIRLIPITNSKYLGHVILQVRNAEGSLVSVTISDALGYLPHEITDEHLSSSPVKELVEINGQKYEKREFVETLHATRTAFVGKITLGYDKYGAYTFDDLPHGITIEKGDTIHAGWTILKKVN